MASAAHDLEHVLMRPGCTSCEARYQRRKADPSG